MHAHQARSFDTVQRYLRDLGNVLEEGGLTVQVDERVGILRARNTAADADGPAGRHLGPGLAQVVALSDHSGELCWYWQWSGETRDAPPEYELIAPAGAIAEVAERVCRVLALASA